MPHEISFFFLSLFGSALYNGSSSLTKLVYTMIWTSDSVQTLTIEIQSTLLNSAMVFAKSWSLLLLNNLLDEGNTAPSRRRSIRSEQYYFKQLPYNRKIARTTKTEPQPSPWKAARGGRLRRASYWCDFKIVTHISTSSTGQ